MRRILLTFIMSAANYIVSLINFMVYIADYQYIAHHPRMIILPAGWEFATSFGTPSGKKNTFLENIGVPVLDFLCCQKHIPAEENKFI